MLFISRIDTTNNYEIKIHNVVTTADLKQKVDAARFVIYPWGTYDLEYYGGRCGYVKDSTMSGRVTVFLSGKMISTGAKSVEKSIKQLQKTVRLLVDFDFIKQVQLNPTVQNIVSTMNVKNRIDLHSLSKFVPKIIYEPDQFPGAILRIPQGPACLVFSTGKIVIVGSKSEKQVFDHANNVASVIKKFRIS